MKKGILLFSLLVLTITLSACNRETDLETAFNNLKEADSYTVYTRVPTILYGPHESWKMREGNIEYHLEVYDERVRAEYFIVPNEDGVYLYEPSQQGIWQSQWIPNSEFEDEYSDDDGSETIFDMDASWFDFDDEYYVLREDYFNQILGDESSYTLIKLRINLKDGDIFTTMDVLDSHGYELSINISVTDINNTELDLPFNP